MLTTVKRYNLFSGGGCVPPYWGLGIWYRAYGRATGQDCLRIAETFRKDNIPCDVFGLEPGWQTHAYSCSYIWNDGNFPSHNDFLNTMKNNNYKINLWEHAFVHPSSPIYNELKPYSGDYEVWNGLVPDFAVNETRDIFGRYHKKELIDKGIDGFKADECDGSDFTGYWSYPDCSEFPSGLDGEQMHNMLGVMYQKTFDEAFRKSGKRTYGSVRASYALASGYPYVLYSDLYDMKDYVRGLVNMGYSGLLWTPEVRQCSSAEDLIKRIALVVFSPAALINCWMIPNPPWYQFDCEKNKKGKFLENKEEVTEIVKRLFRLRMSLVPYLYSAFWKYRETGHPPFRSLVMDNPGDINTYNIDDEYMMGDSLLVAPVFCGTNTRKVYLPEGNWYDFYNNKKYTGKSEYEIISDWDRIPVFVKEDSIVPIAEPVEFISEDTIFDITVKCYGENCIDFDLISDDGVSYDFEKCKYSVLRLSADGCSKLVKSDYINRYNIEKYVYIKDIVLVLPDKTHEKQAFDYLEEHYENNESILNGTGGLFSAESYETWLKKLECDLDPLRIKPGRVPGRTFFAVRESDNRIIGMVNIRHKLNENILNVGGHIGYGVRPGERKKGYATAILSKTLDYCRKIGIDKVLITCDKTNAASSRTIINNGGVLENEFIEEDGNVVERYWIVL